MTGPGPSEGVTEAYAKARIEEKIERFEAPKQRTGLREMDDALSMQHVPAGARLHLITAIVNLSKIGRDTLPTRLRHARRRASVPRPPAPPGAITPTHPTIEAALDDVDFPITKREIMDQVAGRTIIFRGQNADLRELIRDVPDDAFDSEDEFRDALDLAFAAEAEPEEPERRPGRATGRDVIEDATERMDP